MGPLPPHPMAQYRLLLALSPSRVGHRRSSLRNLSVSLANTATTPLPRPAKMQLPSGEKAREVMLVGRGCQRTTLPVSMLHTRRRLSLHPVIKCCATAKVPPRPLLPLGPAPPPPPTPPPPPPLASCPPPR